MAAPRSAAAEAKPPEPPRPRQASARKAAATRRKVAEMLRDLQIDGKALSVEIERLRHRFL